MTEEEKKRAGDEDKGASDPAVRSPRGGHASPSGIDALLESGKVQTTEKRVDPDRARNAVAMIRTAHRALDTITTDLEKNYDGDPGYVADDVLSTLSQAADLLETYLDDVLEKDTAAGLVKEWICVSGKMELATAKPGRTATIQRRAKPVDAGEAGAASRSTTDEEE